MRTRMNLKNRVGFACIYLYVEQIQNMFNFSKKTFLKIGLSDINQIRISWKQ